MKFKILLFSLFVSSVGFAQNMETKEVRKNMSKGNQPGIEIIIPHISEDNLEDAIKKVTKKFKGDREKIKRSNEIYLDDALIKEISENTIDIHQIIEKEGTGLRYTVFFNLGGAFLDSKLNAKKFAYAEEIVNRIALKASEIRIDDILKEEQDKLEDFEDDQKKLVKEKDNATEDIQDARDLIAKREKEIQDNIKMQASKTFEIEKQRKKVDSILKQKSLIGKN
ncbi:hypothetical protein [Flavobacterium sp.]|jgi:hypothetical protein|uniref:hypothetical protein n=1 Tax=Flavobacterium sp. TaxID=239 RepID=UPI002A822EF4|nr:hypothetical protein [Flavobacterium sp.]